MSTRESATWRTDDPCPACGTPLHCNTSQAVVTQACPACGWTASADLAAQAGAADD
jgi:hypothetical protein